MSTPSAPRSSRLSLAAANGLVLQALPDTVLCWGPLSAALAPVRMRTLALTLPATRQPQFLAGRAWAARALLALGVNSADVTRASDGSPQWPTGVVGSIAHDDQRAAALVALARNWAGVGVDVEPFEPLPEDAASLVLSRSEREQLAALTATAPLRYGRLPFAAKECVHKSLHPLTGAWLEFDEVEIRYSDARLSQGVWQPQPLSRQAQLAFTGLSCSGRWWRDDSGWLVVLGLRRR